MRHQLTKAELIEQIISIRKKLAFRLGMTAEPMRLDKLSWQKLWVCRNAWKNTLIVDQHDYFDVDGATDCEHCREMIEMARLTKKDVLKHEGHVIALLGLTNADIRRRGVKA